MPLPKVTGTPMAELLAPDIAKEILWGRQPSVSDWSRCLGATTGVYPPQVTGTEARALPDDRGAARRPFQPA